MSPQRRYFAAWLGLIGVQAFALAATRAAEVEPNSPRLVVQTGHSDSVIAVAFSPDGQRVVTGSWDSTALIWDVATGKQLRQLSGHSLAITGAGFSPDGRRIVTLSYDQTARIWDVDTGQELRRLKGDKAAQVAAYSSDGKRIVTGSWAGNVALIWDADTGEELRQLTGHKAFVSAARFSSDGKRAVTGSWDRAAIIWDADTGQALRQLTGHQGVVVVAAFSPDGTRIVTASEGGYLVDNQTVPQPIGLRIVNADRAAWIWDADTGQQLRKLTGHTDHIRAARFSPDGRRIVTGSWDQTARIWDADTGQQLRQLKGHTDSVLAVAYSRDGKRIITGGFGGGRFWGGSGKTIDDKTRRIARTGEELGDPTARIWDADTGQQTRQLTGQVSRVYAAGFSRDGKQIVTGSFDGKARIWDAGTGGQLRQFAAHGFEVFAAEFSPDGKRIVTASWDKMARILDADTGQQLSQLAGHTGEIHAVRFSRDGKRIVTGSFDQTARIWDAGTGQLIRQLKGHTGELLAVGFSPDGKRVVTGSRDGTARIWDANTGQQMRRLEAVPATERGEPIVANDGKAWVFAADFSPDGKRIVTAHLDNRARIWNADTGQEIRQLAGHTSRVGAARFSSDGKRIVTGSWDTTARIWDADTFQLVRQLAGHQAPVDTVGFSPDGQRIITGGQDKTTRMWDANTGKELCLLASFTDGTWAVADPEGRFDASNGGDVDGLHWVVGNEPIALHQLKERYYDPGLLAKQLGLKKEPLLDVAAFRDVELFPEIVIAQRAENSAQFGVRLTNRGGGIGRVVVLVNGKELSPDARPRGTNASAEYVTLPVDLTNDPRIRPGQANTVEVVAYNADGYLSSRALKKVFQAPGAALSDPPRLHAVVVGVSEYRGEKMNLRYAAKDAEDFATALRLAAERLFTAGNVNVTLLTTATPDGRPTRAAIGKALAGLKASKPGDVIVVYLAGHGVTHGGEKGDWYYLTADAQSGELADPEVRKQVSMSSTELTELLKGVPALKQVLILDTCQSGRVVDKLTEKRDVPGSQVRALERVKDRTGMHVLAGCAADAVSYEASRYGQGILTYSLLLGMRGAKLREGEYVDVVDLFAFAADKVPELARDIGGVQRPTVASPRGTAFDIGRLTAEDKAKIPLQGIKPVLLRCSFQEEERARDGLGLTKRLNDRLRDASAVARGAKLVFVDADEFPGALQAAGRYQVVDDKATVNVTLFEEEKEVATFVVDGSAANPDELATKIAAEVEKRLAGLGKKSLVR